MKRSTILVVDDDPDFCEIARLVLEPSGFDVITASNQHEAWSLVYSVHPDLIMLDVVMSTPTAGIDLYHKIVSEPSIKNIPVVFVTSIGDTQYADMVDPKLREMSASWLEKPVSPKKLIDTVRTNLDQKIKESD